MVVKSRDYKLVRLTAFLFRFMHYNMQAYSASIANKFYNNLNCNCMYILRRDKFQNICAIFYFVGTYFGK